jgi:hypothetical protein
MYSPAINCAGAPGTSVFPSTAYVCEISVTVNTAPAAVKTAISVPVTGALVLVVVLFTCVKVLWTGGEAASASAALRRSSCQLSLLFSPCSLLSSAFACRLSSTSSPRAVGCGLGPGIPTAMSGRVGAALVWVAATAVAGCERLPYS